MLVSLCPQGAIGGNAFQGSASMDPGQIWMSRRVAMVEHFQRLNAPVFHGTEGSEGAEQFVRLVEKIFRLLGSTDEEKLILVEYQLKGEADEWWETVKDTVDNRDGESAWERFKVVFFERFFPEATREAKAREFEVLVQGRLTFEQYGREFTRLSRYAPHLVRTPGMRARRFERGVNAPMREQLVALNLPTYEEVLRRGLLMEGSRRRVDGQGISAVSAPPYAKRMRKSHRGGSQSSSRSENYSGLAGMTIGSGESGWRPQSTCVKCGRCHDGPVCGERTVICHRCGQKGHKKRSCPRRTEGVSGSASQPSRRNTHERGDREPHLRSN